MPKTPKIRILVTDDEPKVIDKVCEYLEEDFELFSTSSGFECLRLIEDIQPSLILLDVHMVGLSGYEVCQRLRENTLYADLSIIMMSGLSRDQDIQKAYDCGANYFIAKPFEQADIVNKILISLTARMLSRPI